MSSFFSNLFGRGSSKHECAVCLLPVNAGDAFTDPSGCGHLLHLPCFMRAHQNMHSLCPSCRAPFIVGQSPAPTTQQVANRIQPGPQAVSSPRYPPQRSIQSTTSISVPPEELFPLPPSDPVKQLPDATPELKEGHVENINLILTPEVSEVARSSEQRLFVNVSTQSVDLDTAEMDKMRVGVDLVAILDKSGSMGGAKEALLRDALSFVIGELGHMDRLCTIAFDSRAHFEHGLVVMNESGKSKALESARGRGLSASGGTNIYDGLFQGVAALDARKIPNAVSTVFLLTDGIDDSNLEEKLALARHIKAKGWFLFIFAFGADHNATHLNAIAEAADSSYIFIDNVSTVREAFAGAIGSQQSVAGKLLNVTINALDENVFIKSASAGQYATNISADRRMAVVSYPNLLVGEKRDCCVELQIPEVPENVLVSNVLSVSLTYTPLSSDGTHLKDVRVVSLPCIINRPAIIETPPIRNVTVDAQINRLNGIGVIELATASADRGELDEARRLVTEAKANMLQSVSSQSPATQAMIADLTSCMGRLQSAHEWKSVGRSEQIESCNVHKFQRGVFSKTSRYDSSMQSPAVLYSNASSVACQSKAKSKF